MKCHIKEYAKSTRKGHSLFTQECLSQLDVDQFESTTEIAIIHQREIKLAQMTTSATIGRERERKTGKGKEHNENRENKETGMDKKDREEIEEEEEIDEEGGGEGDRKGKDEVEKQGSEKGDDEEE